LNEQKNTPAGALLMFLPLDSYLAWYYGILPKGKFRHKVS